MRAGRVDICINNAGITRTGPLLEQPLAELRELLETNVIGQLCLCQARSNSPQTMSMPWSVSWRTAYCLEGGRCDA